MDFDIFFTDEIHFPRIDYEPRMTVYIPMPKHAQEMQLIQGNAFTDKPEVPQETILTLFFASICHAAGHAKVTDFKI